MIIMSIMITMIMDMMIMVMDMKIMVMDMKTIVMDMKIMDMTMGMETIMAMMTIMKITNIQLVGIKIMVGDTLITEEMIKNSIENMSLSTMKILTHPNWKSCQSHPKDLKKEITFNCSLNMVLHEINFYHQITQQF